MALEPRIAAKLAEFYNAWSTRPTTIEGLAKQHGFDQGYLDDPSLGGANGLLPIWQPRADTRSPFNVPIDPEKAGLPGNALVYGDRLNQALEEEKSFFNWRKNNLHRIGEGAPSELNYLSPFRDAYHQNITPQENWNYAIDPERYNAMTPLERARAINPDGTFIAADDPENPFGEDLWFHGNQVTASKFGSYNPPANFVDDMLIPGLLMAGLGAGIGGFLPGVDGAFGAGAAGSGVGGLGSGDALNSFWSELLQSSGGWSGIAEGGAGSLASIADLPWGVNPQWGTEASRAAAQAELDSFMQGLPNTMQNSSFFNALQSGAFTLPNIPPGASSVLTGGGGGGGGTPGVGDAGAFDQWGSYNNAGASGTGGGGTVFDNATGSTFWDSKVGKFLSGNGSVGDYISALGTLGSLGLGALGSNAQANAIKGLGSNLQGVSDQYLNVGAPYRGLLMSSYLPGFDMRSDPAYAGALDQSAQSVSRALSANVGNLYDNPGGKMEAQKYVMNSTALPALQTYRSQLINAGGLGLDTSGSAAINGAQLTGQLNAQNAANQYNTLGFGLSQLGNMFKSNPQDDFLKALTTKLNTGMTL